jgi:hypothetical protein
VLRRSPALAELTPVAAGHHEKADVSTRAAAALWAMQHAIVN